MQLGNRPEETSRREGNGSLQEECYQETELMDFRYDQPGGKVCREPERPRKNSFPYKEGETLGK